MQTTCSKGTFLAASYALALTNTIASNATAAGQAFAAGHVSAYACRVAPAVGASVAMATAGCASDTVHMLSGGIRTSHSGVILHNSHTTGAAVAM